MSKYKIEVLDNEYVIEIDAASEDVAVTVFNVHYAHAFGLAVERKHLTITTLPETT